LVLNVTKEVIQSPNTACHIDPRLLGGLRSTRTSEHY